MGSSISRVLDPDDHEPGHITVPAGYVVPKFPSLYIPSFSNTKKELGVYIYEAESIWHFVLYWDLILIGGSFVLCALLAAVSLLLSLTVFRDDPSTSSKRVSSASPVTGSDSPSHAQASGHQSSSHPSRSPTSHVHSASASGNVLEHSTRRRRTRKRPPLWPVFLIPVVAFGVAGLVSLISGTVVGFVLATVYSAGGFSMSTWVPFLWALIQVLVLIISSYSTLTSIL